MKAPAVKEESPQKTSPAPVKRAYEKPAVTDLGDVRELTKGGNSGKTVDGKGLKRLP